MVKKEKRRQIFLNVFQTVAKDAVIILTAPALDIDIYISIFIFISKYVSIYIFKHMLPFQYIYIRKTKLMENGSLISLVGN
jgi:hypothetical protein